MPFLPVARLMCRHGQDFIVVHLLKQGIVKNDPFHLSNAGKIGIRVSGSLRGIHFKNPLYLYANLLHELGNTFPEWFVLNRCKFVKERIYYIRKNVHHDDTKTKKKTPYPHPP